MGIKCGWSRWYLRTGLFLALMGGGVSCGAARPAAVEPQQGRARLETISEQSAVSEASGQGAVENAVLTGSISMPTVRSAEWQTRDADEVAPGFTLELRTGQDAKIAGMYEVDPEGILKLPYDVEINTSGMSLQRVQEAINQSYLRFLRNPSISVQVAKRQYYVNVRGLVVQPGHYLVGRKSTLDEVIAKAGGLKDDGGTEKQPRFARIQQLGVTKVVNLKDYFSGSSDGLVPEWQGGEIIFFQNEGPTTFSDDRQYIQIIGEVAQPGAYAFVPQRDFLAYLVDAGGPTSSADLNRISVLSRRQDSSVAKRDYDFDDVPSMPAINPGDTIVVYSANPSELERGSTTAGGFAAVLGALLILIGL